jgi:regulator of sigma E protease
MAVAIIAFIIVLLFLVTIHEFGHFILARHAGVTVHEFAIGMWPKIWSFGKDKKGTEFTIRLFPIGGYVKIKGETPSETWAIDAKDSFINASFLQKVAILLGGITMNIIGAWIIFTIWFWHGIKPIQVLPDNALKYQSQSYLMPSESFLQQQGLISGSKSNDPAAVVDVIPDMLGAKMGIQVWDKIVSVWAIKVGERSLTDILQSYIGQSTSMLVQRGSGNQTLQLVCPEDSCVLGVQIENKWNYSLLPIKFPLWQAMGVALAEMRAQSELTFNGLASIFKQLWWADRGKTISKLSGPIGAAKVGQFVLEDGGWLLFLMFGGMLSMALAIFNLLPIPALDGGRLLGVIIQSGLHLKPKKYFEIEWWINTVFFFLLLALWVYIMAHDLVKAWGLKIPGIN